MCDSPMNEGGTVINPEPVDESLSTRIGTLWHTAMAADARAGSTLRAETPLDGGEPERPPTLTVTLKTKPLSGPNEPVGPAADYELRQEIGQGGMAVVYEARQTAIDRSIAVKMIRSDLVQNPHLRDRFLFEAAVTGDLEHPNIIPVYDLGNNEQGLPFYAMRRIQGRPWSEDLPSKSQAENIAILMSVADAVAYAHSRGVIHRDLKPENVMLGDFGEILVIDWGIAVSYASHGKAAPLDESTKLGGTPVYMAPEMAAGDLTRIGPASDIYLLGAILFETITGRKPHPGRNLRTVLLNAARNEIAPVEGGGESELLAIARRAMATEPRERYESVKAFQTAIYEVRSHAESLAFSSRAQAILARAQASGGYDEFAQAVFVGQEALKLWDGNRAAFHGIISARLAWAGCACDKGDLDLAETLLEAGGLAQSELGERVRALKERRRCLVEEKQALERKIAHEEHREWHLVFEDRFQDADFERRWEIVGGSAQWCPGELRLHGGRPQLAILRLSVPGDVRLEFDCRQDGDLLSDLNCFIGAPPDEDRAELASDAYAFALGTDGNRRSGIYRQGKPLFEETGPALVVGQRCQVRAERVGPRLTFTVNGRVICDLTDPEPLPGEERGVLGLAGWMAGTRYTAVRVWRLGAPLKADLLEWAGKFLARGHYETAIDLFTDAAEASADQDRIARARQGIARAERLREMRAELPALQARLAALWPQAVLRIGDHGLCLSLGAAEIESLEPLRGIPLADLECEHNRIESLEPLTGMPLRRLICQGNRIASLAPLRGMPLLTLNCGDNRIESLEPLRGMCLDQLWCNDNRITDLEPLRGMPLSSLRCFNNPLTRLDAIFERPPADLRYGAETLDPADLERAEAEWLRFPDGGGV